MFLHIVKQSEYLHDICNKPYLVYTNTGDTEQLTPYEKFDWSILNTKVFATDLLYLKYLGINLPDVEDLGFIRYYLTNKAVKKNQIQLETFYRNLYPNIKKTNLLLPDSFILDNCRQMYEQNKSLFADNVSQFYKKQLDIFYKIESNGIMYGNDILYSKYNFFTTTGRPSSRFGGINFAALNKKDGSRNKIKSKYEDGILVEVDFQSYHPRLIADLIGYNIQDNTDVYEYFAKYYYKTDSPTKEQVKLAKDETFRRLYSKSQQTDDIPYFDQMRNYVHDLWSRFNKQKQIETPVSGRSLFYDNYDSMNESTLFNYMIQLTETERNISMLHNNPLLDNIILYIYDAILLDIKHDKLESTVELINNTVATSKYPVKIKVGSNYGEMQVWSEKGIFIGNSD
jgi:hypothetical protein